MNVYSDAPIVFAQNLKVSNILPESHLPNQNFVSIMRICVYFYCRFLNKGEINFYSGASTILKIPQTIPQRHLPKTKYS